MLRFLHLSNPSWRDYSYLKQNCLQANITLVMSSLDKSLVRLLLEERESAAVLLYSIMHLGEVGSQNFTIGLKSAVASSKS